MTPVICINKVDLVDRAELQPIVGVYSRMGYRVLLVSAETGFGIQRLRRCIEGRESVVAGQSGVGKSSLLNAVDAEMDLLVSAVSRENQKRAAHHNDGATSALEFRGLCGRHAGDSPISLMGRDS